MMVDTIDHLVCRRASAIAVWNLTGHVIARCRHDVDRPSAPHQLREVPPVPVDAGGSWGGCVLVHAEEPSGLGRRVRARHEPVDRWKRLNERKCRRSGRPGLSGRRVVRRPGGSRHLASARSPCAATQNEPCTQEQRSAACEAGQIETRKWKRARVRARLERRRSLRGEVPGGRRCRAVAGDDGTARRCPGREDEWPFPGNFRDDVAAMEPGTYYPKTI